VNQQGLPASEGALQLLVLSYSRQVQENPNIRRSFEQGCSTESGHEHPVLC